MYGEIIYTRRLVINNNNNNNNNNTIKMLTLLLHNVDRETFEPSNIVFGVLFVSFSVFDGKRRRASPERSDFNQSAEVCFWTHAARTPAGRW